MGRTTGIVSRYVNKKTKNPAATENAAGAGKREKCNDEGGVVQAPDKKRPMGC